MSFLKVALEKWYKYFFATEKNQKIKISKKKKQKQLYLHSLSSLTFWCISFQTFFYSSNNGFQIVFFGMCSHVQLGCQASTLAELLSFVSVAARIYYPNTCACLVFLKPTPTHPATHTPRGGNPLCSASTPVLGTKHMRDLGLPSAWKKKGDQTPSLNVLVLETTTFLFPCAECRYSSSQCPISTVLLLFKVWFLTSRINITWYLVRNANSWTPTPDLLYQNLKFSGLPGWFAHTPKFEKH